jgi:hypothetical protein
MIRSHCLITSFPLSVLLVDTGLCQDRAVAVSAGPDGSAQITLPNVESAECPGPHIHLSSAPELSHKRTGPQLSCRACGTYLHALNAAGNNLPVRHVPTPRRWVSR